MATEPTKRQTDERNARGAHTPSCALNLRSLVQLLAKQAAQEHVNATPLVEGTIGDDQAD